MTRFAVLLFFFPLTAIAQHPHEQEVQRALIELETWGGDDLAFLLVRDPKWLGLADTDLVVVKDSQTATGGECAECGAKVGKHWYDCLSCGAVFG